MSRTDYCKTSTHASYDYNKMECVTENRMNSRLDEEHIIPQDRKGFSDLRTSFGKVNQHVHIYSNSGKQMDSQHEAHLLCVAGAYDTPRMFAL